MLLQIDGDHVRSLAGSDGNFARADHVVPARSESINSGSLLIGTDQLQFGRYAADGERTLPKSSMFRTPW